MDEINENLLLRKALADLDAQLKAVGGREVLVDFPESNPHGFMEKAIRETGYVKIDRDELQSEIEIVHGLLSLAGHQIALYIYQPYKSEEQLRNPVEAPKFHLTDCYHLRKMREDNRLARYVAHRLPNQPFPIRYQLVTTPRMGR